MKSPPRLKLYNHQAFSGITAPALPSLHGRWGGTVHSMTTGLRGTGVSVYPNGLVFNGHDDVQFNTEGILFDFQFNSAVGSVENIVRHRILSSYFVGLRRTASGYLQYFDESGNPSYTSTRIVTSSVVRKLEWLNYHAGTRNGLPTGSFQVWLEGELWLEVNDVYLPPYSQHDAWFDSVGATDFQIGDFAMFVGSGGYTDGDVRSDTAGNPRILPIYVDGAIAGSHSDGTPTGAFTNPTAVDEQPASDTGTYNTIPSATPDASDSYRLETLPGTVTRILGLSGMYFTKTNSGVAFSQPLFLRINPAVDEYAEGDSVEPKLQAYTPASTFTGYSQGMWRKSPATGRELTVAEVNGCELGWRASGSATDTSVSHVYAEVLCYVDPPAAPVAPVAQKSLVLHKTNHRCSLYKLEPRWGMPMYFTDHITPMVYGGKTWEPASGFSSTDVRRELGLKEANVDIFGAITSTKITIDDLRAGRYKQARLTQYIVDHRYPDAGPIKTLPWTIEPDEIDGEKWLATASGIQARLQDQAGDAYYPRCRFHLFDDDYPISTSRPTWERGCKLDSFGFMESGFVGTVTDRRVFQVTDIGAPAANYYNGGLILFQTGNNKEIVGQIKSHTAGSNGTYSLHLPMPFDVTALDTVTLWPGCNFLIGTVNAGDCEDKFDNVKNFGGFMLIPGTDSVTRVNRR